jgi:hypothetical protein
MGLKVTVVWFCMIPTQRGLVSEISQDLTVELEMVPMELPE